MTLPKLGARFPLPFPRGRTARHVPGRMNGTEKRYAQRLENRRLAGEVAGYWFESVKFRLADKTWYAPDFLVMLADGTLELHETKGWIEEDAAVKMKVTSEVFWLFKLVLVREKPQNVWTLRSMDRVG